MKNYHPPLKRFLKKATLYFSTYLKCFFTSLLVLTCIDYLPAQVSRVWDYPIHYGTPEWEKLTTFSERLKAYNVPNDLLQCMTTEDLVKTCLTYPEWLLISGFNNFQTGYNAIKSVFNGFEELEKRPDSFKELFKIYKEMNPEEITRSSNKGKFTFEFTFIELLLSQNSILSSLSNSELISLIKTSLSIYENKCKYIDVFSTHGLSTTCMILGRILEQSKSDIYVTLIKDNPGVQDFVKEGYYGPHKALLDKIVYASKTFLEQL